MPNGDVRVQIAAHEIGNGVYTVLGQMAAERLGVDLSSVTVEVGDSRLPPAPVAGGSNTTASACSAVMKTCDAIRGKLFRAAVTANDGPLAGRNVDDLTLKDGKDCRRRRRGRGSWRRVQAPGRQHRSRNIPNSFRKASSRMPSPTSMPASSRMTGGPHGRKGDVCDGRRIRRGSRPLPLTREIRVPRIVGAFAAGRLMNTRTAHSQLMGGMIWGISSALHEATEIDMRYARYVNDNLADYSVPVNADVQQSRGHSGAGSGSRRESGRRQRTGRTRQCRHRGRHRQCRLSRDWQANSAIADPHRETA